MKSAGKLHNSTKKTGEYNRSEERNEGDNERGVEFFAFDAREIHRADIEHRFGRAVHHARATGDIAVHAVAFEDIGQYGDRAAAREGFDEHERSDLLRYAQKREDRREPFRELCAQPADGEQHRQHRNGGDIGKEGKNERRRAFNACRVAVVYADFAEVCKAEREQKNQGNDQREKMGHRILTPFVFKILGADTGCLLLLLGRIKRKVSVQPSRVENKVVKRVGRMIEVGFALCIEVSIATIEAGKSCKEVAFSTKNIAEAYSASGVLSRSFAAFTPYGVVAPEIPSRLTERFIHTAPSASSSSVRNNFRATGLSSRDMPRATPLSSHTRISPIHRA